MTMICLRFQAFVPRTNALSNTSTAAGPSCPMAAVRSMMKIQSGFFSLMYSKETGCPCSSLRKDSSTGGRPMSPCIQLANRDCVPKADTLLPVTDSTSPRPLPLAASRVWANSASICAFNSAARASLPKIRARVSICFSPLVRILPLSTVRSMVVAFFANCSYASAPGPPVMTSCGL